MHLCSGRGALQHAVEAFESIQPEQLAEAQRIFHKYDWRNAPTEFIVIAGTATCGEIINEALEEHYEWALSIADEGERRFGGSFIEPEVLRDRGIVRLALNDYAGAITDLERARNLKDALERETGRSGPPMTGLDEPLEAAKRLLKAVEVS